MKVGAERVITASMLMCFYKKTVLLCYYSHLYGFLT